MKTNEEMGRIMGTRQGQGKKRVGGKAKGKGEGGWVEIEQRIGS